MTYPNVVDIEKRTVRGTAVFKVYDASRRNPVGDAQHLKALRASQAVGGELRGRKPSTPMLVAVCYTDDEVNEMYPFAQYTDAYGAKRWYDDKTTVEDHPRTSFSSV